MTQPLALVILDGFGVAVKSNTNAISQAKTPCLQKLLAIYPNTVLQASGPFVGLPEGFQGNSEVGHLTIGAGRVIEQPITTWLAAIEDGSFYHNKVIVESLQQLKNSGNALHIMGLLSDGGVHCNEKLIYASIEAAVRAGIRKIVVHVFLDGRDSPAQSAQQFLQKLENFIKSFPNVIIGSLHGRFYAMDRDNNWERTQKGYDVLTKPQKIHCEQWEALVKEHYAHGITDEFIEPVQLTPDAVVENGDGILFCNTRSDRARQLTACFVAHNFSHFTIKPLSLAFFMTPVEYATDLPTRTLFQRPVIKNTFKDVLAAHNKTILSIAETEKYAHVTYFFRGEQEEEVGTENRVLINSIKTKSYADYPEMSAYTITQELLVSLCKNTKDFYLINYANADMVGHSGDMKAKIKAIECLDICLNQLYETIVVSMSGTLIITADHGNAEHDGNTHTTNPVPFILVNKKYENSTMQLPLSELADIAPFILQLMNLPVPEEMK